MQREHDCESDGRNGICLYVSEASAAEYVRCSIHNDNKKLVTCLLSHNFLCWIIQKSSTCWQISPVVTRLWSMLYVSPCMLWGSSFYPESESTTFECEQMLGFEEPQQNLVELSWPMTRFGEESGSPFWCRICRKSWQAWLTALQRRWLSEFLLQEISNDLCKQWAYPWLAHSQVQLNW